MPREHHLLDVARIGARRENTPDWSQVPVPNRWLDLLQAFASPYQLNAFNGGCRSERAGASDRILLFFRIC
jgi:hypothetical protein